MECSYFKITLKQNDNVFVYMVRSDAVGEFFNDNLGYLNGNCSVTVKGRFSTHLLPREWFKLTLINKVI